MNQRPFTTAEVGRLRQLYEDYTVPEIAKILNRTESSITNAAWRNGIHKSKESKGRSISRGRLKESSRAKGLVAALRDARELLKRDRRDEALTRIDNALFEMEGVSP